eukprot:scaffold358187_cov21-Prasinocladus_malaysianus.AAC.1
MLTECFPSTAFCDTHGVNAKMSCGTILCCPKRRVAQCGGASFPTNCGAITKMALFKALQLLTWPFRAATGFTRRENG